MIAYHMYQVHHHKDLKQVNNTICNKNLNNPLGMKNSTTKHCGQSLEICQRLYDTEESE